MGRKVRPGVYQLVQDIIPPGLAYQTSFSEPSILWHYRLGHPSHSRLQQALPWFSISAFDCESCQLGKHHRADFRRLGLVSSHSPFSLVHCDVGGPSRYPSISGFRYYLVDDYSRVC